ncbi:uncharacterized protein LOC127176993 isoform X2 [Labeo rohita]|uniref:uncharacterized protein LOC127176993 isoform X2 n=1 Tax=Labeo rohita TaxID=84645 RepID=UPI0021E214AD|nr:uncharacterized protein LOC127176993 isoform X2 [Labeo rohita]
MWKYHVKDIILHILCLGLATLTPWMSCIMYISRLWIFFGALMSLNAVDHLITGCREVTVNASLKSEVFLPCYFNISHYNETEMVKWSHYYSGQHYTLVTIAINGKIFFDSPKEGRVNVFPLLSKHGNFSILIHALQFSDVGTYKCELKSKCWRVNANERLDVQKETNESNPWFYFAAGAGLFILLFIAFSLLSKFYGKCVNTSSKSDPVNGVQSEGTNSHEERQNAESSENRNRKKRGVRRGPTTIYENDIRAPNQSSAVQQGQNPQRAFRAVPKPSTSHHSDVIPYYVNQEELTIPANTGQRRKKQKPYQIKNPIYGD